MFQSLSHSAIFQRKEDGETFRVLSDGRIHDFRIARQFPELGVKFDPAGRRQRDSPGTERQQRIHFLGAAFVEKMGEERPSPSRVRGLSSPQGDRDGGAYQNRGDHISTDLCIRMESHDILLMVFNF